MCRLSWHQRARAQVRSSACSFLRTVRARLPPGFPALCTLLFCLLRPCGGLRRLPPLPPTYLRCPGHASDIPVLLSPAAPCSPHCPAPIQKLLLDQILIKYGGIDPNRESAAAAAAAADEPCLGGDAAGTVDGGDGSGSSNEVAVAAEAEQLANAAAEEEGEVADEEEPGEAVEAAAAAAEAAAEGGELAAAGDVLEANQVAQAADDAVAAVEAAAAEEEEVEAAGQAVGAALLEQQQQQQQAQQQAQQQGPALPAARLLQELSPDRHMDVLQVRGRGFWLAGWL